MKLKKFTFGFKARFSTLLKSGLIPMFVFMAAWNVSAQNCPLACNNLVQVSLDEDCIVTITPDMMLEGQGTDPSCTYFVTVMGTNNVPLPLPQVNASHIGLTLTVKVSLGANSCWGSIKVEDKLAPIINCPADMTLSCYDNRTFAIPSATDNCNLSAVVKELSNTVADGGCNDNYSAIRTITYQATDAAGNKSAVCTRTIYYTKVGLANVTFPANRDGIELPMLECDNSPFWDVDGDNFPDFNETGAPVVDGTYPIFPNNSLCELNATFSDQEIAICESSYKLIRHWTVLDWCTGGIAQDYQIIKVVDITGPSLTCSLPLTSPFDNAAVTSILDADPYDCSADWTSIAPVVASSECSSTTYAVAFKIGNADLSEPTTPYVTVDGNTVVSGTNINNLPVGRTYIRYTVTDACGNSSVCYGKIDVRDKVAPVAVCDEFTVVTLTTGGEALIYANTFDDGSYDNCTAVSFKARRITAGCSQNLVNWTESVKFCCADVGKDIMVAMQVSDKNNNTNSCMVTVRVQDKIDPVITCPANITINCTQDYKDKSITGNATGSDNCGTPVISSEDISVNIDQCGKGSVTRRWTATDAGGRKATCLQTITIIDNDIFTQDEISWPSNKTLTGCLDSEADPSVSGQPTWGSNACSLVAATYSDQIFTFVDGACFKILRTWSVIDWCSYNQNNPSAGGFWQYTQVIKLNNTSDPIIAVSPITVCAYGENCNGYVDIVGQATDDCTAQNLLKWSYKLDIDGNGTIDYTGNTKVASGTYPVGTHKVYWTVEDGCGNVDTETQTVRINDCKKPTPYCLSEITTVIMPTTGQIDVWASDFDKGSYDNCSGTLAISFSAVTTDTKRTFNCDQLGINTLQMWVTDAAGNKEFCTVKIDIQANGTACATSNPTVSGRVSTQNQLMVEAVNISFLNMNTEESTSTLSSNVGAFQFSAENNNSYQIKADKNVDHGNGVSTADMVLIQKHILGSKKLNNPYFAVAADANGDKTITATDLIDIRKIVLGTISKFPYNKSWRFINAAQTFADANKPWPINENIELVFNGEPMTNQDFKAVKIGDVNGTATTNFANDQAENRSAKSINLYANNAAFKNAEEVVVPIYAGQDMDLTGYQFTINFDAKALDYSYVMPGEIDIDETNVGTQMAEKGNIAMSWNANTVEKISKDKVLFYIVFKAKTNGKLTHNLALSSDLIKAEAYDNEVEIMNTNFEVRSAESDEFVEVYQNSPNPFDDQTTIKFAIKESSNVTLNVFDVTGRVLFTKKAAFKKGVNEIMLTSAQLNATGVLFYQIEAGNFVATKKMIVLSK